MRLVTGKDMTILDIILLLCAVYSIVIAEIFIVATLSPLKTGPADMLQFAIDNPIVYLIVLILGLMGVVNHHRKNL